MNVQNGRGQSEASMECTSGSGRSLAMIFIYKAPIVNSSGVVCDVLWASTVQVFQNSFVEHKYCYLIIFVLPTSPPSSHAQRRVRRVRVRSGRNGPRYRPAINTLAKLSRTRE